MKVKRGKFDLKGGAWLIVSLWAGFATAQEPLTVRVLPQSVATNGAPLRLGFQLGMFDGAENPLRAECFSEEAVDTGMQAPMSAAGAGVTARAANDLDTGRRLYVVANRGKSPGGIAVVTSVLRKDVGYTVRVRCRRVGGSGTLRFGFSPVGGVTEKETKERVSVKGDVAVDKVFTVKPHRDGVFQCAFRIEPGSEMEFRAFSMMPDDAELGLNREALTAVSNIAPGVLSWPMANGAGFYNWYDGVGPRELRHAEAAGNAEAGGHAFGTEEFVAFCRLVGAEPLVRVPLFMPGCADSRIPDLSAGVRLAADWVAYCNGTNGHPLAVLRARHGHAGALGVRCWELAVPEGCAVSADALAETCRAYAVGMKAEDPAICVGVSADTLEKVGHVLRRAGDVVDFVSCSATGTCGFIRSYNCGHGARVAVADTVLRPLRDRYVSQIMQRLERGDAAERSYYAEWYETLGVASAALERLRRGADGVTCALFESGQLLHQVPYARNMLTEKGLLLAFINRFPALTPLASEGAPTEADAPFRVLAAWTEDPHALVVFVYNSGPEARLIRLDLTALQKSFVFWLSDQIAADITHPRTAPTMPVFHRQKAGAALTQMVRCECPPASFTRIVVKE